jgi:hypothetical protein
MGLAPPPYGPGITIGLLKLNDTSTNKDKASDCKLAYNLLNKSTIDTANKMASDPAFNLSAQLLGAILNVDAGAAICAADSMVINEAEALLANHKFVGTATYAAFNATEAALANSLASLLDKYNNNGPCPASIPTAPLINSATTVTFKNGTPSIFTITTLPFPPVPAITESGSLTGSGITFVDNLDGTATLTFSGAGTAKTYNITLTATNSSGSYSQSFSIIVQ